MPIITIFASTQACPTALDVALDMRKKGHDVRPLSLLPRPRPVRLASLQLELAELLQIERTIRWVLSQYAEHRRLPDARHQADLQADLAVTLRQIEFVLATLSAVGEGQGNG